MIISTYQVSQDELERAACRLIEKCFINNMKLMVVVKDQNIRDSLDKTLWTFSQKKFIPHGTNSDDFAEIQPIYITSDLKNLNNSSCLLAYDMMPDEIMFQDNIFERLMFMLNEDNQSLKMEIKEFINKSYQTNEVNHYSQNAQGNWEKSNL